MKRLTLQQKETIFLLNTGTFLEYFDLMLYVHMAVLLNEIFFPSSDAQTKSLISAFAFCSTYVTRPLGALIFGYIGDTIGRRAAVTITTFMMSISCIVMATVPTYAQIGIAATWIITICRVMQGISSMGEVVGARIYLTETIPHPFKHVSVACIGLICSLGGLAALAFATYVTSFAGNWRIAFWVGASISTVGLMARLRLHETPEFSDMKRRIHLAMSKSRHTSQSQIDKTLEKIKAGCEKPVSYFTILAYGLLSLGVTPDFYFRYVYCTDILLNTFHLSATEVIQQNLFVALITLAGAATFSIATYWFNPLKITKVTAWGFLGLILLTPMGLESATSPFHILFWQGTIGFFALNDGLAFSIVSKHFPVFKRFRYLSFLFAFARAIATLFIAFGTHYTTKFYGYYGIWLIMLPTTFGFMWGTHHFIQLEKKTVKQLS